MNTFFAPAQTTALEPRVRAVTEALKAALPRRCVVDGVAETGPPSPSAR